jgi:hypothetical protein
MLLMCAVNGSQSSGCIFCYCKWRLGPQDCRIRVVVEFSSSTDWSMFVAQLHCAMLVSSASERRTGIHCSASHRVQTLDSALNVSCVSSLQGTFLEQAHEGGVQVRGFWISGGGTSADPQAKAALIDRVIGLMQQGVMRAEAKSVPLAQWKEVMASVAAGSKEKYLLVM